MNTHDGPDADRAGDDRADIALAVAGNGDAYARIIRRHQAAIARRMARFSRSPADIEAMTHDVFVEAFFSLRQFRGDAPLGHWLQRIATHVGYRFWKTARRQRHESLDSAAGIADPRRDAAEQSAAEMQTLLARLPPRDRLVLTLLYVEQRTIAQAAEISGWSQTMIKVQAFRARGKLKRLLDAESESKETPG